MIGIITIVGVILIGGYYIGRIASLINNQREYIDRIRQKADEWDSISVPIPVGRKFR